MLSRFLWAGTGIALWAALAVATASSRTPEEKVRYSLHQQYPEIKADTIVQTSIPSLYQVSSGALVFYMTEDGRYLFSGDLIDFQQDKKNVTEMARQEGRLRVLSKISQEDVIVYAPEHPKYTVTVFTDTECGYCREFHKNIKALNKAGIAVRYLAFPRQGPESPAYQKAASVWCASDKHKAFDAAKSATAKEEAVTVPLALCSKQVDKSYRLAQELGVNGTPTLVLENGALIPGFVPPAQLLKIVEGISK